MKRFSETLKWEDEWFVSLPAEYKLVFLFMLDKCDCAGFFEPMPAIHPLILGIEREAYLGAIQGLNKGLIYPAHDSLSNKVFIANFLRHQKNLPLNPENNAHKPIIESIEWNLKEFNSVEILENLGANQGLIGPIGIGKVKVEDKKGGEGGKQTPEEKTELIRKVVEHLNLKTGTSFKPTTDKTKRGISARIAEGVTLEDFILVIEDRSAKWGADPKMQEYLRPETLFGTKFEGYLETARKEISSDPATKYEILKARGWDNCTEQELVTAYKWQNRSPDSYTQYSNDELLMKEGYPLTKTQYLLNNGIAV